MEKIIGNFLEQLKVGRKQSHKNLALYPVFAETEESRPLINPARRPMQADMSQQPLSDAGIFVDF